MSYHTATALSSGPGMVVGDPGVFNVFLTTTFKERIIVYGDAGRDLNSLLHGFIPSVRPLGPMADDLDSGGFRVYKQVVVSASQGVLGDFDYVPVVYGELTPQSFHALQRQERMWDDENKKFIADRCALVQYLLLELSLSSKVTLKTHPSWDSAVETFNHIDMFMLILLTHRQGNSSSRVRHLRTFVSLSQGQFSLNEYIGRFRPACDLLRSGFESAVHPGYMSIDMVSKYVFLIGLNQVFFERPIQRLAEEKPDSTALEAMVAMQNWVRDHAQSEPGAAANHVPRAMVVSTVSNNPYRGQFGPYDAKLHKQFCKWCWDNGFKQLHVLSECRYRLRTLPLEDRVREKAKHKESRALVAPVAVVAPVVAPAVVVLPVPPAPLSRMEQGRLTHEIMQEYYESVRATQARSDTWTPGSHLAIMPPFPPSSFILAAELDLFTPEFLAGQEAYLRSVGGGWYE